MGPESDDGGRELGRRRRPTRERITGPMTSRMDERSRQIGDALRRARERARRSVRECALLLGTSPRRYAKLEQGTVQITAVELETMAEVLDVPPYEVWPMTLIESRTRRVVVEAEPGESVQVVVNIAPAATLGAQDVPTGSAK
ncbi:MAG: helix-turn-helix transcriptional regulator [Chloroflexota bacterium]|nr:helix-turn-helix transcriptional regulator [Chloroflexota bacterium]